MAISYFAFTGLHFACFALAVTVCGLYGTDLHHSNQFDGSSKSKWVYAVVVGALSAVTSIVYAVPFVLRVASLFAAVWDLILFILWITLFGVFGKLFIDEHAGGNSDIKRMKNAVWVDLASAILWLLATVATFAYWFKHRDVRSRFTGRAHV
ncbi:hypothetical protein PT974_01431 [Cladobotryum mycophilum]|uniref:MARVEL domain-containing protein n=1 Tax=Cladobotryum mycophilum TaxID=491253 RepID=A0ABR0T3Q3_9HYPO